jgi:hypothetical protein
MASKVNRYGRQVFLSRWEIQLLRDLANTHLVVLSDERRNLEDLLERYRQREDQTSATGIQDEIDELDKQVKTLGRLIGDNTKSNTGKLWYYVEPSEAKL